jgi:hypothetical protein
MLNNQFINPENEIVLANGFTIVCVQPDFKLRGSHSGMIALLNFDWPEEFPPE